MSTTILLNEDGEVVATLADGWTLRSGVYEPDNPDALTSGEYVRLVDPDGAEYLYWDQEEWKTDPALVMGAIINSAAGLRLEPTYPCDHCEAMVTDAQYETRHTGGPCPERPAL